jgi:hypothetical protein
VTLALIVCYAIRFNFSLSDPTIANCSTETKNVGTMVRNQLFNELFAYYSEHKIFNPELRLGNLLMITPAILVQYLHDSLIIILRINTSFQQYARMSIENFRMIKFFDLVSYNSLLDELFS